MAITDKNDPLLVADKMYLEQRMYYLGFNNTSEVCTISTALKVYITPRDTLEVTIPTTLEVCNVPTTLEVCNIPTTLEVCNIQGNILEVCNIPTTDNTLDVYDIPGNMLEV